MEKLGRPQKWICGVVLALGTISAVLGLFAEVKRVKGSQIRVVNNQCVYPNSPALVLGVVAALVLLVAQVIVNVVGGCICCTPGPPAPVANTHTAAASNRSIAVICLVACWITFLNAFALLMAGASLNNQRQQYMWFGGECNVVKPLVFAGGALLALATVVLGLIFYLASSAVKASLLHAAAQGSPPQQQIDLGQNCPPYFGPRSGNGQTAYPYPYPPSSFNQQMQQMHHIPVHPTTNANDPTAFPAVGYPGFGVVTGYPKPMSPSHHTI